MTKIFGYEAEWTCEPYEYNHAEREDGFVNAEDAKIALSKHLDERLSDIPDETDVN